jgi:hypothetical protein
VAENEPIFEQSATTLLGGIVRDGQQLLHQQLEMLRSEVKQELHQLRSGLVSVCIGVGVAAVGGMFLLVMLVHLLDAYTEIPLWGCYGIVGGALGLVGGAFLIGGRKSVSDLQLSPPPATARALKENIEWIKNLKHRGAAEPTT